MSFLRHVPPMGIYETLYAFQAAFGRPMGEPGTHPWSQGFPRTVQLPGGPPLPTQVTVTSDHLKYPKAWGLPALREAIAGYYRRFYDAPIDAENVMVFAGGRPALIAVLLFLDADVTVRIASTEYTPYYDMLERLGRRYTLAPSTVENRFWPPLAEYRGAEGGGRTLRARALARAPRQTKRLTHGRGGSLPPGRLCDPNELLQARRGSRSAAITG